MPRPLNHEHVQSFATEEAELLSVGFTPPSDPHPLTQMGLRLITVQTRQSGLPVLQRSAPVACHLHHPRPGQV